MRRSICYCEPATTTAGAVGTWRFIHTTATALPKNAKIRFDLQSNGRAIDWEIPTCNLKKSGNVIYFQYEDGEILAGKEVEIPTSFVPQFEFTLTRPINAGESFAIIIGAKDEKALAKGEGNRAQTSSQRRRPFALYIDPTGKQRFGDPEFFSIDVTGGLIERIKILAPSFVGKNKRFDVVVRFEDEYGNLTSNTKEETLIELTYEHLRENLNWKLFIPETGFITLPNLYFNEAGVYTIQLKNLTTKETFRSSPIRCSENGDDQIYWGSLHGESDKIDSTDNIDSCLRHFRDDLAHHFYALSPFEQMEETSSDIWKACVQTTQEFDEDDRFNTFVGYQWVGEAASEGVRHILYLKDQKQLIRKKDAKGVTLDKLVKNFNPKEALLIPCFTMGKGYSYNFDAWNPEFERVVEIFNSWGSSEEPAKSGNQVPISSPSKTKGISETAEGAIINALNKNCRFGFSAGGLDDRGIYSDLFTSDQTQYPPGLTAILSPAHTKQSLAEALYQRSLYATTGEKIVVEFHIAGAKMGQELNTSDKPGLMVNRHITGFIAGTKPLETIEIIRNGKVIHTIKPTKYWHEFAFDDMTPLDKEAFPAAKERPPFAYYYLRVSQEDGHMAWSSPIWIDIVSRDPTKRVRPELKKPAKKLEEEAEPEEVEEEDEVDYSLPDDDEEDDE